MGPPVAPGCARDLVPEGSLSLSCGLAREATGERHEACHRYPGSIPEIRLKSERVAASHIYSLVMTFFERNASQGASRSPEKSERKEQ